MDDVTAVRVYLDTNIISRLFDRRVKLADAEALAFIAEQQHVVLAVSDAVLAESQAATDPVRRAMLRFAVGLFDRLRWEPLGSAAPFGGAAFGAMSFGGGVSASPLLVALRAVFDEVDARHITQAKATRCTYFLTLDGETILGRRTSLSPSLEQSLAPLQIVSPQELAVSLGANNGSPAA